MTNRTKLLVLHGALGSAEQLDFLKQFLSDFFDVYTFSFSGHGAEPFKDHFSIGLFSLELEDYILENELNDALIFGYSMGGYVALNSLSNNKLSNPGLITLGTKMLWTEEIAQNEIKMLNASKIEEKIPQFAKLLNERHSAYNWKFVLDQTANLMLDLGNEASIPSEKFSNIQVPVMVLRAEYDNMVSDEESILASDAIPHGTFSILKDSKHPIEQVSLENLKHQIDLWMTKSFNFKNN